MQTYHFDEIVVDNDGVITIAGLPPSAKVAVMILEYDEYCRKILMNLSDFEVIVPNQIRKELSDNLSKEFLKYFYQLAMQPNIHLNYEVVPDVPFCHRSLSLFDTSTHLFCGSKPIELYS
jgi:hypothetical protein